MRTPERKNDIEIDQDLDFQSRYWMTERISWILIAVIVLTGSLGLFGSGPLSKAIVGDKRGSLWLEYNRFERLKAPTGLSVHLGPEVISNGMARIWLSRYYLERVQIEHVIPQPKNMEAASDRFIYVFKVAERDKSTLVIFHLKPEKLGVLSPRLGLVDAPSLSFGQLIYP